MKYLKQFKKLLALTASAAMLTFLPNANALTASAEEPVTYYLMYIEDEDGSGWEYQARSEWDDSKGSSSLQHLASEIKNGDVVIVGNGSYIPLSIDVHLSNLTFVNSTELAAMVSVSGGIDDCFINKGGFGIVTGAVTNAYVYGESLANFSNNVGNLYSYELNYDDEAIGPTIDVAGTVSYYVGKNVNGETIEYGSNFQANSFSLVEGVLKTETEKYTQDISGGPVASAAKPASTSQNATSSASKSGTSSDEYDAVPKTGESSSALWLCLAAAVCLSGSLFLKRSAR